MSSHGPWVALGTIPKPFQFVIQTSVRPFFHTKQISISICSFLIFIAPVGTFVVSPWGCRLPSLHLPESQRAMSHLQVQQWTLLVLWHTRYVPWLLGFCSKNRSNRFQKYEKLQKNPKSVSYEKLVWPRSSFNLWGLSCMNKMLYLGATQDLLIRALYQQMVSRECHFSLKGHTLAQHVCRGSENIRSLHIQL